MPSSGSNAEGYRIVDLGSANGTFVNGQPVDQTPLQSGDRVQLGQTVMLFHEGNGGRPPRLDSPRRPAGQEQPRRPLGHPEEHPFRTKARASSKPRTPRPAGCANG